MRCNRFSPIIFLSLTVLIVLAPEWAFGQTVTLTSPLTAQTVKEGDDFASTVLKNPWDMNERRDIQWEENFAGSSVGVSGGSWVGSNETTGGYVFPLFGGFHGGLFPEVPEGDTSVPRVGESNPIDASRYTLLSYKLNHSSPSTYAVYWRETGGSSNWPDGSKSCARIDGYYNYQYFHANSGENIYSVDFTNLASSCDSSAGSWGGNVLALRIDPSVSGAAGAATDIDWIRLVDPASAPTIDISWNSTGLPSQPIITIYADNDGSGYDGYPIKRYSYGSNPGTFALPTAMLPPGDYYFYVMVHSESGSGNLTERSRSGYSARLRVADAPVVAWSAPTMESGADYFTSVVGNPADMNDGSDVTNEPGEQPAEWTQFSSHSFNGGTFQAVANTPLPGNAETDAQVHLNVSSAAPIDTRIYRYVSYRMAIDESQYPTISDKVANGWVGRPIYWGYNLFIDGGRPKAHNVYEGWHTYLTDLWDTSIVEAGVAWQSIPLIRNLRIDPLETTLPTWFYLDDVKLHAANRPTNDSYTVTYAISDSDSSSFTVALYYDSNRSGFDGTLITQSSGVSAGSNSYSWNTSGVSDGEYYLYLQVTDDSGAVRSFYSPAPVVVGELPPLPSAGVAGINDFDADGKSDLTVYTPGKKLGYFHVLSTVLGYDSPFGWGTKNNCARPVAMKGASGQAFHVIVAPDKCKKPKRGRAAETRPLNWFVRKSDGTAYIQRLGLTTDWTVPGDYNGDGEDEIAIFRDGLWVTGLGAVVGWGQVGDYPVPADYDGDGKTDIAIFRPADGMWWILNSSGTPYHTAAQWGLWGDIPVPGDYDGDGKVDMAVFRPAMGMWFVKHSSDATTQTVQWGISGDLPVTGHDTDGNGSLDFIVARGNVFYVYDPASGYANTIPWGSGADYVSVQARKFQ